MESNVNEGADTVDAPEEEHLEEQEADQGSDTSADQHEEQDSSVTGSDSLGSSQTVEVIDSPEAAASGMSYNVAVLFILSMIVGLLIFNCLSRRWHS